MRIVLGVKTMKFKTFGADDERLKFLDLNGASLQVKQTYFHLYFIPVLPLSKQYFIISKAGIKRALSDTELNKISQTSIRFSFPFLSFSLPILLVLGFLVYSAFIKIDDTLSLKKQEKGLTEYYSSLQVSLRKAKKNDLLIFYRSSTPATKGNTDADHLEELSLMKIGAWVKERKGNKLKLCFIENGTVDFYSIYQKDLDKIPDMPGFCEDEMDLSLDELEATIPKEAQHYFYPSRAVVRLGKRDAYYSLDKIVSLRVPLPEIMMSQGLASNGKYILMNLANMGVDAKIEEIKTLYGDLNWIEKFPLDFPACARGNGCSIQLGANFQRNKFPIQVSKMKITFQGNRWLTYLIVVTEEDVNLIYLYRN